MMKTRFFNKILIDGYELMETAYKMLQTHEGEEICEIISLKFE